MLFIEVYFGTIKKSVAIATKNIRWAMNIFDNISESEKHLLYKCVKAVLKNYKKGELVFSVDENIDSIVYVIEGNIELTKNDYNGNEIILTRLGNEEIFAETFVCAGAKSIVQAKAIDNTKVLFLNFNNILNICPQNCIFHKKLLENLIKIIAQKNLFLQDRLEMFSHKTLKERIIYLLTKYKSAKDNSVFEIPYSREQMAQYLGVNRSALSKELAKLKSEKILDFHRNSFKLFVNKTSQEF